jgi:hypothetical protein
MCDGSRRVEPAERRARLARRPRLAPGHRAGSLEEAARSVVCLRATDPATVYLSAWVRMDEMAIADVDRALYEDRSVVKQLAVRRTLFAFPREAMAAAVAGPSARVAVAERRRLIKEVEAEALHGDGAAWLAGTRILPHCDR